MKLNIWNGIVYEDGNILDSDSLEQLKTCSENLMSSHKEPLGTAFSENRIFPQILVTIRDLIPVKADFISSTRQSNVLMLSEYRDKQGQEF